MTADDRPGRSLPPIDAEWLEADAAGGFASGTVGLERTRRYHALLLTATRPPAGRVVLVGGVEAWIETPDGRFPLSTHRYVRDVVHPRGTDALAGFTHEPWPTWTFALPDGSTARQEVFVARAACETVLRWSVRVGRGPGRLLVRPLIAGRDYHALHRENRGFAFDVRVVGGSVSIRPYPDLPAVAMLTNGSYRHAPEWFRQFLYVEERERGLDHVEDLASPGEFAFDLDREEAVMVLRAGDSVFADVRAYAEALVAVERARRAGFADPLSQGADSYVVRRGNGRTLVAGFPWFTDWGRDTFISLRGLCTARGRHDVAEDILLSWAREVSDGMLPNRFPDSGEVPEYNSVDAALWFVAAAHDHLRAAPPSPSTEKILEEAVQRILQGYMQGTRFGIRADGDGLLAAGRPDVSLTWMDARVDGRAVTPRIGKPVEVEALWINALAIGGPAWAEACGRARAAFSARFWNAEAGCLFDVVDVDHAPGRADASIRPNQILAVGGLPYPALDGERAKSIVEVVERHLLTPLGLRSLSPADPAYRPHYRGGVRERDAAYHQGTAWPWLIGPFVEAWLRVRGASPEAKREAEARFLAPLREHLGAAGLGHVSEIAGAEPPHAPAGCPFQAWSLGEMIRAERLVREGSARGAGGRT